MAEITIKRISFKEELIQGNTQQVQDQEILNHVSIKQAKPDSPFGESILINIEETGIFAWQYSVMSGAIHIDTILFKVA